MKAFISKHHNTVHEKNTRPAPLSGLSQLKLDSTKLTLTKNTRPAPLAGRSYLSDTSPPRYPLLFGGGGRGHPAILGGLLFLRVQELAALADHQVMHCK